MRSAAVCLLLALLARAEDPAPAVQPVPDEEAKAALEAFEKDFKTREIPKRQHAVYDLHDVRHELAIKKLESIVLRDRSPEVRNVAALALGGQTHDVARAGAVLMRVYERDFDETEVFLSVLEALAELKYMGYWPTVQDAMKDERNAVVIRVLDLLGENQDWRAIPKLLDMYQVALPRRVSWSTGEVTVDTGSAGDEDQRAAEAAWTAKYGAGGSKEKAKAKAKARAFDERNFSTQLRKCVKAITGQDFENAFDFEDWYVVNYIEVQRKIAVASGDDPAVAERRARTELPALKSKLDEERAKIEAELEAYRKGTGK